MNPFLMIFCEFEKFAGSLKIKCRRALFRFDGFLDRVKLIKNKS